MSFLFKKIGLVDSGLGGLTVLNKLISFFPAHYIYFADTKNLPYGPKTNEQLMTIAFDAIDVLLAHEVEVIIIACHTLSAVALRKLQKKHPHMLFIGMIDGVVNRALQETQSGNIGVIATSAAIKTSAHKKALLQLNNSLNVVQQACPDLVPAIERIPFDPDLVKTVLAGYLEPLRSQHIDTLILGCTHYALIKGFIAKAFHDPIRLVSADEEIEQIFSTLQIAKNSFPATVSFVVSGDEGEFFSKLPRYFK